MLLMKIFPRAGLAMKKGVGRIHSQSRGCGREIFFLAPPIQNMLRGPCGSPVSPIGLLFRGPCPKTTDKKLHLNYKIYKNKNFD